MNTERRTPKKPTRRTFMIRRIVFGVIALALLILLIVGLSKLFYALIFGDDDNKESENGVALTSVTVEAGTPLTDISSLLTDSGKQALSAGATAEFITDLTSINWARPADMTIEINYTPAGGAATKYSIAVFVRDTTAPVGNAVDRTIKLGEKAQIGDFVANVKDCTNVAVTYVQEPDWNTVGTQSVELLLTDTSGNVLKLTASLTIEE